MTESFVNVRIFPAPLFGMRTPHVRWSAVLILFAGCHIPFGSLKTSFSDSILITRQFPVSIFQQKWNPPWCRCLCRELIIDSFWQFWETVFVTTVAVTNTTATHITSPVSGSVILQFRRKLRLYIKSRVFTSFSLGSYNLSLQNICSIYLYRLLQRRNHYRTNIFFRLRHIAFGP